MIDLVNLFQLPECAIREDLEPEGGLNLPNHGDSIRKFVSDCMTSQPDMTAGGQVERVATRFALVGAAGELATRYGLTDWREDEAMKAAGVCFWSWLNLFGGSGNREERQILEQVRAFLGKNGSSRFQDIDGVDKQRIIDRAGFYRVVRVKTTETIDGCKVPTEVAVRQYLVLPEAFKQELCAGSDSKLAVKVLKEHGWLELDPDGRSSQSLRLPGIGTARVYVFSTTMWEEK